MPSQSQCGFLILDRKGEYIKDTLDQRGNTVVGLQHHPNAKDRMVVVSFRDEFHAMAQRGEIFAHLTPQFNIRDIDPTDLADFLPGLTDPQADLVRDYAHLPDFYSKLLAETAFGAVNNRNWFKDFPGLFELNEKGKKLIKDFERQAEEDGRDEPTEDELGKLHEQSGGRKHQVLERVAHSIKRFCQSPFFGRVSKGKAVLAAPSCVAHILKHLEDGRFVFIDMRGETDENYTMIAALFARRFLTANKGRDDEQHIRACIVMEEAHNILDEDELGKGNGRGSVFVELAREGRSFKLGFVLVTQQPDAKSIAPEVVKTIDTVIAFNMPPDDARHLPRLKSAFKGLELEISNAREFRGVAVGDGGPIPFASEPVGKDFMADCANGKLAARIAARVPAEPTPSQPGTERPAATVADRLAALTAKRRDHIQATLDTLKVWSGVDQAPENPEDGPVLVPPPKG